MASKSSFEDLKNTKNGYKKPSLYIFLKKMLIFNLSHSNDPFFPLKELRDSRCFRQISPKIKKKKSERRLATLHLMLVCQVREQK